VQLRYDGWVTEMQVGWGRAGWRRQALVLVCVHRVCGCVGGYAPFCPPTSLGRLRCPTLCVA
jgi:hypothetical protein